LSSSSVSSYFSGVVVEVLLVLEQSHFWVATSARFSANEDDGEQRLDARRRPANDRPAHRQER
jgi:hypothetical protein